MNSSRRDEEMDRLLHRAPPHAPAAEQCPDPETLAAWSEDGLKAPARAEVESHVADCARCQMQLAAIARMAARDVPKRPSMRRWPWLVPITGAAAAAGLWFLAQPPPTSEPSLEAPVARVEPQPAAEKDARTPDRFADPPAQRFESESPRAEPRRRAAARERQMAEAAPPAASAAPAPAPPAPSTHARDAAAAMQPLAETIVATEDLGDVKVERSAEGAVTWSTPASGPLANVSAGASPAPSVFWLVGREGLVLLSDDGRIWRRLPFPERADLIAVRAASASEATVTTADGRTFATVDAGLTWVRQ